MDYLNCSSAEFHFNRIELHSMDSEYEITYINILS